MSEIIGDQTAEDTLAPEAPITENLSCRIDTVTACIYIAA